MINKLAKAQKSWVAKLILSLTALSFMSLFGVSSYLSNANNNRTVIKVDNIEISQAQFSYLAQNELFMATKLLGDSQELTDEMQTALIYNLSQKLVTDSVIDRTADKYNILFSPQFIHSLIVNDKTFRDDTGNFSREMFRELLAAGGLSESEYIKSISRDMVRRLVIYNQVLNVNVPQVLLDAETKVDNKRRAFKYVNIKPSEMKIDRTITEDEANQYYEDFSSNFIEPESRDVSILYLPMQNIYNNIKIAEEDIRYYYDENKSDYEQPEKRQVLQMMFDSEKEANKAFFELQNGKDFYEVAKENVGQSEEDTNLGLVSVDELLPELAKEVFALNINQFSKPIKVEDVWQIVKVEDIKPETKVDYALASSEIEKILKDERLYNESYEVLSTIEDMIGSGLDLSSIAKEFNTKVEKISGVTENNSSLSVPHGLEKTVASEEFSDAVFSYAPGEISQVIETDDGLMVVKVDTINEAHLKPLEEVYNEIIELWTANEKIAIAQEKLNDVMHDMENGDDLSDVGNRYGLTVYKSSPITRNETFANVGYADIRAMFAEALNIPRQMQYGDDYIVAVAVNDYDNSVELSDEEKALIKRNAEQSLTKDFAEALLKSYADDYKIRVKYKLIGLTDL